MGIKTKVALAGAFVGVVAMAAAAFGQTGTSESPGGTDTPRDRRAAMEKRQAQAEKRQDRCGPVRFRDRRLVHAEAKVKVPDGFAYKTIDQGAITAIDHADKTITIKRLDGETVTASAVDETNVCKDGKKAAFDSLKVGDLTRLVQVRSPRFTGLLRIVAVTPGAKQDAAPAGRGALGAEPAEDLGLELAI